MPSPLNPQDSNTHNISRARSNQPITATSPSAEERIADTVVHHSEALREARGYTAEQAPLAHLAQLVRGSTPRGARLARAAVVEHLNAPGTLDPRTLEALELLAAEDTSRRDVPPAYATHPQAQASTTSATHEPSLPPYNRGTQPNSAPSAPARMFPHHRAMAFAQAIVDNRPSTSGLAPSMLELRRSRPGAAQARHAAHQLSEDDPESDSEQR